MIASINYLCEKLTICKGNTVLKQYLCPLIPLWKKHHAGFHIVLGILVRLIPHGHIPKKVPTNHVYIHVSNNFITKKRFQVAPTKQVFLDALMEQQGILVYVEWHPDPSLQILFIFSISSCELKSMFKT